jgi:hypothetical protein
MVSFSLSETVSTVFGRDLEGHQHGKPLKRLGVCEGVFDHRAKAAV